MPKVQVGGKTKHFPYTPSGKKAAAQAKKTGQKMMLGMQKAKRK